MKRILALAVLALFAQCFAPVAAFAAENITIKSDTSAFVESVIDGQTIKVRPQGTEDTALVKLIGVDATSNDSAAADYLNSHLVGRTVSLSFDKAIKSPDGRFNVMYVTCDGLVVNDEMLRKDLAAMNGSHREASIFNSAFYYETGGYYYDSYGNRYYNDGSYYYDSYYYTDQYGNTYYGGYPGYYGGPHFYYDSYGNTYIGN